MSPRDYEQIVVNTRFPEEPDVDWRNRTADFLIGEQLEFLMQHGSTLNLLLPEGFPQTPPQHSRALRLHAADELSDVLWFATDALLRMQSDITSASQASLAEFTPETTQIGTFDEIEAEVVDNAARIRIRNKWGMYMPHEDSELTHSSLDINPGYLITRAFGRAIRSLQGGKQDLAPPTASEMEAIQPEEQAFGLLINAIAFVGRERLGIPLEVIAEFNAAKLENRSILGKQHDLDLDDYLEQNAIDIY